MNQTRFEPQKKPVTNVPPPMVDEIDKASRRNVGVTGRMELMERDQNRMTMIKESQRKRAMTATGNATDSASVTEAADDKAS